ncbi:MAG: branched-chain amino acid ABC transporter permease [Candidatus Peregrinibacteria bacterium]
MQIILNGIIVGGIYALIALGFNLIYSSARFYHLLYGVLAILGVYFTWELIRVGAGFPLATLLSAVIIGVLGMASWQWLYKPMRKKGASDLVMLVTSFGALIVLQNLIAVLWKNSTYSIDITETIKAGYQFLGLTITFNQLVILGVTLVAVVLLELFLNRTKWGMAIRAIGDNAELTTILGLKTNQIVLIVFFVGSAMSSLAATMIALEIGVRPTHGMMLVLKAVIASIIGGIGSMRGAMFGGLLLGVVENVGIYYWGAQWQEVTAFVLLTVFLLFRPQGLFQKVQLVK